MAEPDVDEDLFADLYDNDDADTAPAPAKAEPAAEVPPIQEDSHVQAQTESGPVTIDNSAAVIADGIDDQQQPSEEDMDNIQYHGQAADTHADDRPIGIKEDGKMFIGGLNWETTDQSLKDYFSQFGEVIECTVMRDGATGRSRGFGFLTFKDPKVVNTVMVKEHSLDGKLIDPKRAIPREEQERTAKIFVGGVSQEATEPDFKEFFMKFGRVLDATLMMDKDTGRPRGFGFVTFDNDAAVERTLEGPLAILGKPIEVKRAQPRGKMGEEETPGKFGRAGGGKSGGQQFGGGFGNNMNNNGNNQMNQAGDGTGQNMTPAMMAQYWQRMQQYFSMMSAANSMNGNMNMMGMQNPMMQQMMARQGGMNPAMMQQMAAMQGYPGGMQGSNSPSNSQSGGNNSSGGGGSGNGGGGGGGNGGGQRPGFSAQEQLMFEQQKYERQQMARMQQQNFGNQNTWDGMYDDVPAPAGMQGGGGGNMRGNFAGRGGRGGSNRPTPAPSGQAPANAPTGPKNAGKPGANYRGGGRGGHRGYHPYARGGG